MQKEFSIAEAKDKLLSIIHTLEVGPPVKMTRHGKPVAVLLSIQDYEKLSRKKEGSWKALKTFRQGLEKEGLEISDHDFSAVLA
jgi:prevent-host-death family protein